MTRSEQQFPEVVVGLVATPPDYPARVAATLCAELADRLAERVRQGELGDPPPALAKIVVTLHESHIAWASYERTL